MKRHQTGTAPLSVGLGLKPQHVASALDLDASDGLWFEVHAENHMVAGGPRLAWLKTIAAHFPVSIHGVGLSIAGPAPLDTQHLARLATLVDIIQPALVSEHMAWSFDGHTYYPDLFAPARTPALLDHVCARIDTIQQRLGRAVAVENATEYAVDPEHQLDEATFWCRLTERTGCHMLLDINNALLSAHNLGHSPQHAMDWMLSLPTGAIKEIHLAGYSSDPVLGDVLRIDSHGSAVAQETWLAYAAILRAFGPIPSLIEWDNDVPGFEVLMAERARGLALWQAAASRLSRSPAHDEAWTSHA